MTRQKFLALFTALFAVLFLQEASAAGAFVTSSGGTPAAAAVPVSAAAETVRVKLTASEDAAVPGKKVQLAVQLQHAAGWHTYWKNSGEVGAPTEFTWKLPSGAAVSDPAWPVPLYSETNGLVSYAYSGETLIPFTLSVPADASGAVPVSVHVSWIACKEQCVPGEASAELLLPVSAKASASSDAEKIRNVLKTLPVSGIPAGLSSKAEADRIRISVPDSIKRILFFPEKQGDTLLLLGKSISENGSVSQIFRLNTAVPEKLSGLIVLETENGQQAFAGTLLPEKGPVSVPAAFLEAEDISASGGSAEHITLLSAALFAFLGGLILNLMPCVFPVLSLKMLGLIEGASDRRKLALHGAVFTAGILASMVLLSGLLILLKASGSSIGWGFQLQNPAVILGLSLLFLAIALNLAGLFEFTLGSRTSGRLAQKAPASGLAGSFCTGILAVIVASPCTAPFMGAALGFALSESTAVALTVFLMLGAGMAAPWLLLSLIPGWMKLLPRPGMWMVRLRQIMAVPVALTAVWLLWVLSKQLAPEAFAAGCAALLFAAAALWLYGRSQRRQTFGSLYSASFPAAASAALLLYAALSTPASSVQAEEGWETWSPEAVQTAVSRGKPVFTDFTAAWCVTCQVNKKTVLDTEAVRKELADLGYVRFLADWTNRDAAIAEELRRHGRSGVPLYLVTGTDGRTRVLPELLTRETLISALREGASR